MTPAMAFWTVRPSDAMARRALHSPAAVTQGTLNAPIAVTLCADHFTFSLATGAGFHMFAVRQRNSFSALLEIFWCWNVHRPWFWRFALIINFAARKRGSFGLNRPFFEFALKF